MKKLMMCLAVLCMATLAAMAADKFVNGVSGDWQLNAGGRVTVFVSDADERGVRLAAQNLLNDLRAVCGTEATLTTTADEARIVVGTVGKVAQVKDYERQLRGKREMFTIDVQPQQRIVIAGSDRRGTIYGIYELSRQMGVSPWYYWADVPVEHHDALFVKNGTYTDGEPAVAWRGLFLNDEAPCLTSCSDQNHTKKRICEKAK